MSSLDNIELLDESVFNAFYDIKEEDIVDNNDYKLCQKCNIHMDYKVSNEYICSNCGLSKRNISNEDIYNEYTSTTNYNSLNDSAIKCVGTDSFKYQCILRNATSYTVLQNKHIKNILFYLNYNSKKINIPKDILLTVCQQYKKIREMNNIYRGHILKGILASLVYYECINKKLTHKPKEIAEWFEIDTINMSKGDKIVRTLNEKILNLNSIDDMQLCKHFIYSDMLRLSIDHEYLPFLYELSDKINEQRLINLNSKPSTKAAVFIYILICCKKMDITSLQLYEEFKISVSTFKSKSNIIIKNINCVSDIFNKYDIPIIHSLPRSVRQSRKK